MKIYTNNPANTFVQSAVAMADLAGFHLEIVIMTEEARKDKAFAAKHLTGKFPLLELDDGNVLFESSAIAQFFARQGKGLYGADIFEEAQCDQWIGFAQTNIWPSLYPVIGPVFGFSVASPGDFNAGISKLKSQAKIINTHLNGKSFLVGDNVTVADVTLAFSLLIPFQTVLDAGFRKGMPNLAAWFERVINLPSCVKAAGYIKMCDKALKPFDPKAKPTVVPAAAPKKEEKAAEKKDDVEMDDLFGDDDEEDAEAAKKAAAEAKAKAQKKKKVVIAMSLVMLEVKPLDSETNLDDLAAKIFAEVKQEGLFWKTEYKKEPVAFGIYKLVVGFSCEDEKVSVDDIVEKIEAYEEEVQSVEILAFNKI